MGFMDIIVRVDVAVPEVGRRVSESIAIGVWRAALGCLFLLAATRFAGDVSSIGVTIS
jgi:hypothetical protein